jgi:hypothetical protein
MPRMAAEEPADCEPESFKNPIFLKGFFGIVRAAGIEPAAISDEGADRPLIDPNETE